MILRELDRPLEWMELTDRQPGPGRIRVTVLACGVCRTDLHVVDGELPERRFDVTRHDVKTLRFKNACRRRPRRI
jgi:D-arabinose 1-dehydrogenase-like Zn-dependent alcohol dehydrogenase